MAHWQKEVNESWKRLKENDDFPDGWHSPPAVLPRAPELADGVYYDPKKNTR